MSKILYSLRMRLVLLVVAALLPALVMSLFSASADRRDYVEHTERDAMQLAREASVRERQLFDSAHQLLLAVAQLPAVRSGEGGHCEELLASLLDEYPAYLNIGVIDRDGRVRCSALPSYGGVNAADRSYFQRAVESRRFSVGDYQIGRITGKASVNFGMPILDASGAVESVVFAAMDLSWLRRLAVLAAPPAGTALTIVDANGTILARTLDSSTWVGLKLPEHSPMRSIMRGSEGVSEIEDIDGVRRLCAFMPLNTSGPSHVFLSVGIPSHTAFARVHRIVVRQLASLALVTVLAILAAWFGGHAFIARRVEHIVRTASLVGAGNLDARAKDTMPYGRDEIGVLARVFDSMAESIEQREQQLSRSHNDIVSAVEATIEGWARALERRDSDTQGHTRRVAELAVRLSRAMGVSEDEIVHIRRGALLHDIGKMGIPDSILLKPGPLSEEEWVVMRRHPTYAYEWLSHIPLLRPALDIPFCHHERWDGSGYPRGLVGTQIPLAARIFAVVDNWDAVTSDRPYRDAWSEEHALHFIQEHSGSLFDSRVVDAFLEMKTKVPPEAEVVYRTRGPKVSPAEEEIVNTRE